MSDRNGELYVDRRVSMDDDGDTIEGPGDGPHEWLIRQGSKLPEDAQEVWSTFVGALYEQVPRS